MASRPYTATVFALYQLSVLLGIVLLPIALAARRAGIPLPLDRIIGRLHTAYEQASEE